MPFDTAQSAYTDLRDIIKERSDAIVFWVGAGLSLPANLPSWAGLRTQLVVELRATAQPITDAEQRNDLRRCADEANVERNLWNAFSLLRDKLGRESYNAAIRRAFLNSERVSVPALYTRLWKLAPSGVISLNIDRLSQRGFNEVNPGKQLHAFWGAIAGEYTSVLRSAVPWLASLHGILDNPNTWVFTTAELKRLYDTPGYINLISTCFSARTVVFLGITADDIAAGGHLERLTESGIDCGGHYWITHLGAEKREWAENAGIRIINYALEGDRHTALEELFDDLDLYIPKDESPLPVRPTGLAGLAALPSPDDLERRSASDIRKTLNSYVSLLLAETTVANVEEYERFALRYSESIYRAWFVSTTAPKNDVLGYTLIERCDDGAFGTVYRATDKTGRQCAIKILHEKVRENREMLQSFRRGVKSMRILTENGVPGVVTFHNASEIPALVVMDFIEGSNLTAAVKMGVLTKWRDLLRVATEITKIIRTAHRLPQRVLHRDIRPSNIMLENCWGPNPQWDEVKVWILDFDLSYHLDAFDVSVSQPGMANGYLAPEQANRGSGISTRNAAVDSFGIGMTLYYLRSAIEPRFSEHRHVDWLATLGNCAVLHPCRVWTSLPTRFARLIFDATRDRQEERLDVAGIENELVRLRDAELYPERVASAELIAEELAARSMGNKYNWNADSFTASQSIGLITVQLTGDELMRQIKCELLWLKAGGEHHQDVRKWLPRAQERAESCLRSAGWKVNSAIDTGRFQATAVIPAEKVMENIANCARSIENVIEAVTFR